jgi:hypothetical protein
VQAIREIALSEGGGRLLVDDPLQMLTLQEHHAAAVGFSVEYTLITVLVAKVLKDVPRWLRLWANVLKSELDLSVQSR